MEEKLAGGIRVLLAVVGLVLIGAGIALSSQQAVAVILIAGGIVVFLAGALGDRPEEISLARGGAKWRRAVVEAAREQAAEVVVVRPDPVVIETKQPPAGAESGRVPRRLERSASDTVTTTDTLAAETHAADDAAVLTTPAGFAKLLLETIEGERARRGAEEYWAEARRIGTDDNDYQFQLDLRGLTEDQSRSLAQQARLAAQGRSGSVKEVLDAIAEVADTRAEAMPHGGPPNVLLFIVGAGGDPITVTADRSELKALATALAGQKDELVRHMWRQVARQVAPT